MRPEQIAAAFSRHRFPETYPFLAPDVRWDNVGGPRPAGRDAVIATCEESAAWLAGVRTTFTRFRVVAGPGSVVVDSEYDDGDSVSRVASCDLYDVVAGLVTAIRSYTVELPGPPTPGSGSG
jgi:limonene-1,2-epoxide hydrolase